MKTNGLSELRLLSQSTLYHKCTAPMSLMCKNEKQKQSASWSRPCSLIRGGKEIAEVVDNIKAAGRCIHICASVFPVSRVFARSPGQLHLYPRPHIKGRNQSAYPTGKEPISVLSAPTPRSNPRITHNQILSYCRGYCVIETRTNPEALLDSITRMSSRRHGEELQPRNTPPD